MTIPIKDIPEDIAKFLMKIQGQIKTQKCVGMFSLSKTVLHIIREYKKLIEK